METYYVRNPDMVYSRIDDEIVMLSVESGEYYGLNEAGSRIWEILEKPYNIEQLVNQLMDEYTIDESNCRKDVEQFLERMIEKKLVKKAMPDQTIISGKIL